MKLSILLSLLSLTALSLSGAEKPNVLFIAIDDLRPELGCYGERHMVTPHLDKLASEGRLFRNHYVQVPTCGASRYAMLTGKYPRQAAAMGNNAASLAPKTEPSPPYSLPMLFRKNGYETVCLGKISHSADGMKGDDKSKTRNGEPELPYSWDVIWGPSGEWHDSWRAFFGYAGGKTRDRKTTPAFEGADVSDNGYPDGLTTEEAIKQLNRLKDKPFFLAVGFYKPHLPFNAPKKYWDLYDAKKLPSAPFKDAPANADPKISLHKGGELLGQYTFDGGKVTTVDDANAAKLRHAYFAAVSYTDAQVGRVLDELDKLGLNKKTIVVVWGDHGWHLGDHGVWGKHTLHERSLRSAFIVRSPNQKQPGKATDAIVEAIDILPTLTAFAGIPAMPAGDGQSLIPLLENPQAKWSNPALSFWRNGGHTGQSIRTDRYRLTRWINDKTKEVGQMELYDHLNDPYETKNIALKEPKMVEQLSRQLLRQADN
ncbi:MAG TPA: sulfatase [Verrucomicrobiae bacterium]